MFNQHQILVYGREAVSSVLIVDDDVIIRSCMKKMIRKTLHKLNINMKILEGSTGFDLVNIVNKLESNVKLIFTDENMPICEGSDAIRMIADSKIKNNIKIISITAIDDLDHIQRILSSGADEVISKPINIKTVERIIENSMIE